MPYTMILYLMVRNKPDKGEEKIRFESKQLVTISLDNDDDDSDIDDGIQTKDSLDNLLATDDDDINTLLVRNELSVNSFAVKVKKLDLDGTVRPYSPEDEMKATDRMMAQMVKLMEETADNIGKSDETTDVNTDELKLLEEAGDEANLDDVIMNLENDAVIDDLDFEELMSRKELMENEDFRMMDENDEVINDKTDDSGNEEEEVKNGGSKGGKETGETLPKKRTKNKYRL